MHQSFLEASFKLERLSTYLADNESLKAVAAQFNQELSSREIDRVFSSADRRLTDYTYSIISLYGVFENFNESIIKAYVDLISILVKEYSEFPDRIRQNHLNMTASLILQKGQRKYDDITIESLVSNLDSCINQDGKFTINSGVFTQHTSNFRCDSLNMFYSSIAVEGIIRKVRTMKPFVEYQININGLLVSEVISSSDDKLFSELEDIVQRRNEIAHGVENGDLLELSILKQYISFMQALIESIYLVLKGEYDVFRFERVKKNDLGAPITVHNSSIVCINSGGYDIHVNQTIYSLNESTGQIRMGKIISIKEEDRFLEVVPETERKNIGIKVDFKAKVNCKYYLEE